MSSTWRSVILALVGALVGALLVAPVIARVGGRSVAPTAVQTRAVSCSGIDFHPIVHTAQFSYDGTALISPDQGSADFFQCNASLPHRAVVTKVQFTLRDNDQVAEARFCVLYRTGLTTATAGVYQNMGVVPTTGFAATPGLVRLTDTDIAFATVNNMKFAYILQCQINGSTSASAADGVGPAGGHAPIIWIYGASVTYEISSANG